MVKPSRTVLCISRLLLMTACSSTGESPEPEVAERGDKPQTGCTLKARSTCNQRADQINTQEPAYHRCSVAYANCYTPGEMSTCAILR